MYILDLYGFHNLIAMIQRMDFETRILIDKTIKLYN